MRDHHIKISPKVKEHIDNGKEEIQVIISVSEQHTVSDALNTIKSVVGDNANDLQTTEHYVFGSFSSDQIDRLKECSEIGCIWPDDTISFMDMDALETINAARTCMEKKVMCNDITWAIIDGGIDKSHKAFQGCNIIDIDLTGEGPSGGHGTLVAGVLAGWDPDKPFSGVAPQCQIYNFKVLGKDENWVSRTIIAMEQIRKINKEAGKIVIHGVNLSVGVPGTNYIKLYRAGNSPICEEANRLVESGIVVCAAAGNYGLQAFNVPDKDGKTQIKVNYEFISITDPGNADLPITVGATTKKYPGRYGICEFSSKGPTGDGRIKPDLVAPGEEIITTIPGNGYIEKEGTSIATPFVSGVAAQLLHAYPQLIGKPMEVKRILMESCMNLKRDPVFQGRGLVNLEGALKLAKEMFG